MKTITIPASDSIFLERKLQDVLSQQSVSTVVFAFDFDGVVAHKEEDWVYRLPEEDSEKQLLCTASKNFNYDIKHEEFRYKRHLIYQAALNKLKIPSKPGPAYPILKQYSNATEIPMVILTARAGIYANQRLYNFLEYNKIVVSEVFHTGRTSKSLQIELLFKDYPDHTVLFFEDSTEQIKSLQEIFKNESNLILFHIEYPEQTDKEFLDGIRKTYTDTINKALEN